LGIYEVPLHQTLNLVQTLIGYFVYTLLANVYFMESKFSKKKNYKNLCLIMSPNGMIKEGTILTGEQWITVLFFEVGNSFDQMFEVVP